MSLEVTAESLGTDAGAQGWRQKISDFRRCDRSYKCLMMCTSGISRIYIQLLVLALPRPLLALNI